MMPPKKASKGEQQQDENQQPLNTRMTASSRRMRNSIHQRLIEATNEVVWMRWNTYTVRWSDEEAMGQAIIKQEATRGKSLHNPARK